MMQLQNINSNNAFLTKIQVSSAPLFELALAWLVLHSYFHCSQSSHIAHARVAKLGLDTRHQSSCWEELEEG